MRNFTIKENTLSPQKPGLFALTLALALISFVPITAEAMSLTTALDPSTECLSKLNKQGPNPAVTVLAIGGTISPGGENSPCTSVTISTTDTTPFTAANPLIPVVIGSGGTLTIQDPGAGNTMALYASSFLIQNTGTMQAGTTATPVAGQITIMMAGNSSAALPPTHGDLNANSRDITVMDGGVLTLYGGKGLSAMPDGTSNNPAVSPAFINTISGTKSWTYLAVPAGPASYNDGENVSAPVPSTVPDTTLTLATAVDWQIGDWISVATTSFSSHQTEIVQICAVNNTFPNPDPGVSPTPAIQGVPPYTITGIPPQVSQLTLCNKLKHYHYGGLTPTPSFFPSGTTQTVAAGGNPIDVSNQARSFYDGSERNYGIDERAEVALLSRNIKLTSVAGSPGDANNFIGGHLVAMVSATGKPSPTLQLVGVEIEKFGQALVGRYPVHLHHLPQYQITGAAKSATDSNSAISSSTIPANGSQVTISGVQGNTAANGTWTVTNANADSFELTGSTSNGTFTPGGSGYTSAPTVTFAGGGGTGAQGTATIAGGTVTGVTITNGGSGYTSAPTVTFTGGGGTGALGTPTLADGVVTGVTNSGIWTPATILVQDVSVHHSYNKCFTVHGTANANFYNNACVRTVGQGVYLEDGANITGNQFIRNHIAGTMAVGTTYSFPQQNDSLYWDGDNLQALHTPPSNPITNAANVAAGGPIVITSSSIPANNTQVIISGVQGFSGANGTWTATNATDSAFQLQSVGNGAFTASNAALWMQKTGRFSSKMGGVSNASNASPIVITSSSGTVPDNGKPVTVSSVNGNTAANGTWIVANANASTGTFTLQSFGSGTYSSGGTWGQAANWYNVNNIPDTSFSGANASGSYSIGPDMFVPGGFWITNLGNTFVNNSVAGCQAQGRGYWLLAQNGQNYNYPEFTGNRAHGCYHGIDTQPNDVNASNPQPTMNGTANDHAPLLLLNDNTVTRSRSRGFWGRGIFVTLHNNRFATNLRGFTLLGGGGPDGNIPGFWGMAHENVIAGMTRNNVERYPACSNNGTNWQTECTDVTLDSQNPQVIVWGNYPSTNMNIQGYTYYDGPARIEHNRFVNFRYDPTGIHPNDPAARLLTVADINKMAAPALMMGQLTSPSGVTPAQNAASAANFEGYAGDPATGWQQSNAQSVPPTQYIQNSIWDNVDFKHQVYTEAVNMGNFSDGDKTTVILDKDSQLTGLGVAASSGVTDVVPTSLNNLDYYATDFTVDEPHSRGPNNFRASSLMSPHKYSTLNIESPKPTLDQRVEIKRDMPTYGDTVYPSLFLYGRGGNPIYEPFVMDRMGYTVYKKTGQEHGTQSVTAFEKRLLFSYTDPAVKKAGDFFVNRIAVYQTLKHPTKWQKINVYRTRRQWGQLYTGAMSPPGYVRPIGSSCDNAFLTGGNWTDCINRAKNQSPYNAAPYTNLGHPYGMTLQPATDWTSFEQPYKSLMGKTNPTPVDIANFITNQTFYYDSKNNLLYFYMIEDAPVQSGYAPYGSCNASKYNDYVQQIQGIKNFSDQRSVQAALDASCLASDGTPQKNDMFSCNEIGCAAYLVDFSSAGVSSPPAPTAPNPITGASNASPIVITSANAPPTGTEVVITGVGGNTNANGTWTVKNTGANTFSLKNSTGNGAYTSGSGVWSIVPHPIHRTEYKNYNQYTLVYGTPLQQPNGLPVAANLAIGNTPPPQDGAALVGSMTPTDGTPPPLGDRVTYNFQSFSGVVDNVTENFTYRCVTTPSWSPVNARGAYPPSGGFTYPLHDSVCAWELPHPIATVAATTAAGPITITVPTGAPVPPNGAQVILAGVNVALNGSQSVTSSTSGTATTAGIFQIQGLSATPAASGGTWQLQPQ
ncbi:MAG: G8 domain-containing protein [Methylobacter tundripaludum]|nr:G8 domain-containing protein [Methylobacter tundripaludum]